MSISRNFPVAGALAAWAASFAVPSQAAVIERISVDQHGDFVLVGNTLAQNCAVSVPDPTVGEVGDCGFSVGDTGADVFWGADPDGIEAAVANEDITVDQASSVAMLTLPAGAVVTHAQLYWSSLAADGDPGLATFGRDGTFSARVSAAVTTRLIDPPDEFYQSSADVSVLVQAHGAGAYRLSGIDMVDPVDTDNSVHYAGWWMVVFYELASEPLRNLTLFDGFELVSDGDSQSVTLSGFTVPAGGFDAKLGVVAYEGDASLDGDELRFGPELPLDEADALADSDNFFDASRLSASGDALSVPGDLPQLTGEENSMSGLDLDVVDVTERMLPGQTSAGIQALTDFDLYLLGGFVTSVATFRPDFTASVKSVRDVNGAPLRPGDELEYSVAVTNTGTDAALDVLLLDVLPASVSYVPNSLQIFSGPNAGLLTDGADADQGEVTSGANQTVVVRLGVGADAEAGGRLAVGQSSVVIYRVAVDAGASGSIENQAEIAATGELGDAGSVTPTDGNLDAPGAPPTVVSVDGCASNADCSGATAFCDTAQNPRSCVECLLDAHCPGLLPSCSAGRQCVCSGSGAELQCDGKDDNCNAAIDEGFIGIACSSGVGACARAGVTVCDSLTTTRCAATPGTPGAEICLSGADEDCDGLADAVDPDCLDSDGDALPDAIEAQIGTDPADADTDDDGVADGLEPSFDQDTDLDGLINALDVDSDNDALLDGTETGASCTGPGTRAESCVPDADRGATVTNPLVLDTDGGGSIDGSEDPNLDGAQGDGETDPTAGQAADDGSLPDADNDVLSDALERFLGSDPRDADSDDDGLPDGLEPNPSRDGDADGWLTLLDQDSDSDGLLDGTESGRGCDDPATHQASDTLAALLTCRADADPSSVTSPLLADTDQGGVSDGQEDADGNGLVDPGETDPREPADDDLSTRCATDDECGAALSGPDRGRVCLRGSCIQGCRDASNCPAELFCNVLLGEVGRCQNDTPNAGDPDAGAGVEPGGGAAGSGAGGTDEGVTRPRGPNLPRGASLGGGACTCRLWSTGSASGGSAPVESRPAVFLLSVAFSLALRRRRAPALKGNAPSA